MRVSLLIIGLYLVATSIMGNSVCVWDSVKKQTQFVYWIAGAGVLWAAWNYTPEPYEEVVHWLVGAAILGLLVVKAPVVKTDIQSFWNQLKGL